MSTYFNDPDAKSWVLPEDFAEDDVRLSEFVIERYIDRFTDKGDLVFDPFAGYGTTLIVAERMGRMGAGCEIVAARAEYANSLLGKGRVIVGDVREVDTKDIDAQLIVSSPPYMNRRDAEDPLGGYEHPVESYEAYIVELASAYVKAGTSLRPDGRMVIQLQNLRNETGVTALAFDLYAGIGDRLEFHGEEVTLWKGENYGYAHGYCLIYGPA